MDPAFFSAPSGCLVVLIPLSGGMAEDARIRLAHRFGPQDEPDIRELPKQFAARYMVDELLDGLVNSQAQGYPVPLDVAVLGYNAASDGKLNLVSLLPLPYSNPETRFVSLTDLAGVQAEARRQPGAPRKWIDPHKCSGMASPAAGLAEVYRLVSVWLTGRYTARPPVVIHCTDGEGFDDTYARIARSMGLLATTFGPARLLHYGFSPGFDPTLSGEWPETIPEPWAGLMDLSWELPAEPEGRPMRRAVSLNDWAIADAWNAVFEMQLVEEPAVAEGVDESRLAQPIRELWTQKMGNKPEEWEDACASDAPTGTVVIADGASSGIYCRTWADQLSRRFVTDHPDARDAVAFGKWVQGLRAEWRAAINYPTLHWAKQRKVEEVGAAATFLGLEVGGANASGSRRWRACAVGDATLFWVRDNQLMATFPVVAADQFGSAPLLIRSNAGFKTLSLIAAGECKSGDRFFLATDAVASRLFRSLAVPPGPDWDQLAVVEENAWRQDMDDLRRSHDMVNDDCTLVVARVPGIGSQEPMAGDGETAAEPANIEIEPLEAEPEIAPEPTAAAEPPAMASEPFESPMPNETPSETGSHT